MEDFIEVVLIGVGSFLFIGAITGLVMWFDSASCHSRLEIAHLQGVWGPLVECQVRIEDGSFIPYDQWRGMEQVKLKRG